MFFNKTSFIPPVIAHRGASAYTPENTVSAFLKARELGCRWVELDAMPTAAGEVVVMHDDELSRTTNGQGKVIQYSYQDLKKLDAGSWFNSDFAHERIPLLQDILQLLYQQQLAVNLEIKSLPRYEEMTVQRIADILEKQGMQIPVLISSFSPIILKKMRAHLPRVPIGILLDRWETDWQDRCIDVQAVAVHINHLALNQTTVNAIKTQNYLLLAYTVNTSEHARELFAWGVDAVFSDCPDVIIER